MSSVFGKSSKVSFTMLQKVRQGHSEDPNGKNKTGHVKTWGGGGRDKGKVKLS